MHLLVDLSGFRCGDIFYKSITCQVKGRDEDEYELLNQVRLVYLHFFIFSSLISESFKSRLKQG